MCYTKIVNNVFKKWPAGPEIAFLGKEIRAEIIKEYGLSRIKIPGTAGGFPC